MSRQLMVLRHAHAGREPGLPDHERPLSARGRTQAERLGAVVPAALVAPVHVVVSSAVRAHQTWSLLSRASGREWGPWATDPRVYRAVEDDLAALLDVIHDTPRDTATLVLVGHDPGFTTLIHALTSGEGEADAWTAMQPHLRKASAAILTVTGEWSSCGHGSARLQTVLIPRDGDG